MADTEYQTVGFHFMVTFHDLPDARSEDVRFQSVSGLDTERDTEGWKEGGENRFEHTLPGRTKFSSPLTLKRGLLSPHNSGLTTWCRQNFARPERVVPLKIVSVELLCENHAVLLKWDLEHVWPKSWKIAELNAERSEVLIETLELNYNRLTFKTP